MLVFKDKNHFNINIATRATSKSIATTTSANKSTYAILYI